MQTYSVAMQEIETELQWSMDRLRAVAGDGVASFKAILEECKLYRALAMRVERMDVPPAQKPAHAQFVEGIGVIGDAAEQVLGAYAASDLDRVLAACGRLAPAFDRGLAVMQRGAARARQIASDGAR